MIAGVPERLPEPRGPVARRRIGVEVPDVPFVPWDAFLPEFVSVWGYPGGKRDAEHVTVIGRNGSGKTVLLAAICRGRAQVRNTSMVMFATKPADSSYRAFRWPVITKWDERGYQHRQVVFHPPGGKPSEGFVRQRAAIRDVLDQLWTKDANTVVIFDEVTYLEDELELDKVVRRYQTQGRSLGLTVVAGTQRPRVAQRTNFSEPAWIFCFHLADQDERKRLGEIGGDYRELSPLIATLGRHEVLVIRRDTREMVRTRVTM